MWNWVELIAIAAGGGATALVCLDARRIGTKLGILAEPDKERRLHIRPTPQVGGIAILTGLILWAILSFLILRVKEPKLLLISIACAFGVGGLGLIDDRVGLSPVTRIFTIFLVVGGVFAIDSDLISTYLNWGSFEPSTISPLLYVPLMALASGGVVNAVNMADGQDGVVGSMFVTWTISLMLCTEGTSQAIAAMLCLSSLIFLVFNLRGKIFLGDCGSYGVTFVLGLLVTLAHARGQVSLETVMVWFFIPIADCIRLLVTRPLRGGSPFKGDRDHFHHRLELKMGKHKGLMCYASAVAMSSLVAALAPRFALVCLCLLSAFYFSFAWLTESKAVEPKKVDDLSATQKGNIVPLMEARSALNGRRGAA